MLSKRVLLELGENLHTPHHSIRKDIAWLYANIVTSYYQQFFWFWSSHNIKPQFYLHDKHHHEYKHLKWFHHCHMIGLERLFNLKMLVNNSNDEFFLYLLFGNCGHIQVCTTELRYRQKMHLPTFSLDLNDKKQKIKTWVNPCGGRREGGGEDYWKKELWNNFHKEHFDLNPF